MGRLPILLLAAWFLVVFGVAVPAHLAFHHHEDDGGEAGHDLTAVCLEDGGHLHSAPDGHQHSASDHSLDLPFSPTKKGQFGEQGSCAKPEAPYRIAAAPPRLLVRHIESEGRPARPIPLAAAPRAPPSA